MITLLSTFTRQPTTREGCRIPAGEVRTLHVPAGQWVRVVRGEVWITQSGDPADHVLRAGESYLVGAPGRLVAQPLTGDAELQFV